MRIAIAAGGCARPEDLIGRATPPAWRKATRNMVLAALAMERAMSRVQWTLPPSGESLGLVFATNSGEIETSAEFIKTLSASGVARPLLFQNSLHNATAGFSSIHFGCTGPAITISDSERSPAEAVHLAQALLRAGECQVVIATLVEVHKMMADYIGERVAEGAVSLVFVDAEWAKEAQCAVRMIELSDLAQPYEVVGRHRPLFDITNCEFFRVAERWGDG